MKYYHDMKYYHYMKYFHCMKYFLPGCVTGPRACSVWRWPAAGATWPGWPGLSANTAGTGAWGWAGRSSHTQLSHWSTASQTLASDWLRSSYCSFTSSPRS